MPSHCLCCRYVRSFAIGLGSIALLVGLAWSGNRQILSKGTEVGNSKEQEKINRAIGKGVMYLKKRVQSGGDLYSVFPGANAGANALVGLTLTECGLPVADPSVQKVLANVRASAPKLTFTYSLALSILFLDRLGQQQDRPTIRTLAHRLLAGQTPKGGWSYHCPILTSKQEKRVYSVLKKASMSPGNPKIVRDDNSNLQFVVLALWAARKYDVPAESSLRLVAQRFVLSQNANGSWGYFFSRNPNLLHHSTTCAGLLGLAVGRGVTYTDEKNATAKPKRLSPRIEAMLNSSIEKGLRYLSNNIGTQKTLTPAEQTARLQQSKEFERLSRLIGLTTPLGDEVKQRQRVATVQQRPLFQQMNKLMYDPKMWRGGLINQDAWGDLYFLWSIERVAVTYRIEKIGPTDWYDWGSKIIVGHQNPDGSWQERFPGVPDTCFALLFLRRANLAESLTRVIQKTDLPKKISTIIIVAPPNKNSPDKKKPDDPPQKKQPQKNSAFRLQLENNPPKSRLRFFELTNTNRIPADAALTVGGGC